MSIDPHRLSDDELDRLILSLDPIRAHASSSQLAAERSPHFARVSPRDHVALRRSKRGPVGRRRPPVFWSAALSAMVLVASIVLVLPTWLAPAASALTPQPLHMTGTAQSLEQEIEMAQARLRAAAGPASAERRSCSVGWYLHLDHLPRGETSALIAPEVTDLTWNQDLSGRRIITAGEPYWADGTLRAVDGKAPVAGSLILDTVYPARGFDPVVTAPPGDTRAEMLAFLAPFGASGESPQASDVMAATWNAFTQWTLTNEQHAQILGLILSAPGARIEGTAIDRAGREVTVVSADSSHNPNFRLLMLISQSTGRIVGSEDIRLTPLGDLPVGAVTSYTLWDTE